MPITTLLLVDIDNTITKAGLRLAKAGKEPPRHDRAVYDAWVRAVQDEERLLNEAVIPGMVELVNNCGGHTLSVTYLTSREEKWRGITKRWLKLKGFKEHSLVMRPDGDYSETAQFKERSIDFLIQLQEPTNVVVIDDDQDGSLQAVCRERGWTFLKAVSGL